MIRNDETSSCKPYGLFRTLLRLGWKPNMLGLSHFVYEYDDATAQEGIVSLSL